MLIFPIRIQEIHTTLTNNRIWKVRLVEVGMINKKIIETYALTGPIIRGSNVKFDLRLLGYEFYNNLELGVTAGAKGDCLDRYLIRMNESLESIKIIQQLYHTWKVIYLIHWAHTSFASFAAQAACQRRCVRTGQITTFTSPHLQPSHALREGLPARLLAQWLGDNHRLHRLTTELPQPYPTKLEGLMGVWGDPHHSITSRDVRGGRQRMESLIDTFRFIFLLLLGSSMIRQEAPKGELSLYIVTDNRNKVYRLKIRSPD